MEISSNISSLNSGNSVSNANKKIAGNQTASENSNHNPEGKQKLKEAATEMIKDPRVLGEWKDKKGLDQIIDPTLGGDIRYALTSKNPDFLKRIRWGPLTVGEYREVQYRIRELESKFETSNNVLSGKIIDTGQLFQEDKSNRDQSQFSVTV